MEKFLPEIYSYEIISKYAAEILDSASGIFMLAKSNKFQNQIYKLFQKFSTINMPPNTLLDIISKLNINKEDKTRLKNLAEIYKKYMNFLAEKDYSIPKYSFKKEIIIEQFKDFVLKQKLKVKSSKYIEFDDSQNEIIYIANKIKTILQDKPDSTIGIYTVSSKQQREFLEIFNHLNITTNFKLEDEQILYLRIKYEQILNFLEYTEKQNKFNEDSISLLKENLGYESSFIEEISELYKNNFHKEILEKLIEKENIENKNVFQSIFSYIEFSQNILCMKPKKEIILGILDKLYINKNEEHINNLELTTNLSDKKYEYIFIPNLVEGFMQNSDDIEFIDESSERILTECIKTIYKDFDTIYNTKFEYNAFGLIKNSFDIAENVILSTNNWENTKKTFPSPIFEIFKNFDSENYKKITEEKKENNQTKISKKETPKSEKIFDDNEPLVLSASAIKNFQQCPKKFFYQNILNLKEKNNFSASYGTCIHAIFEILNSKFLNDYTPSKMRELSNILFNTKNDQKKAEASGFSDRIIKLILNTDDLSIFEMKEKILNAIYELEKTNFFENIPQETICEKSFNFNFPQIPNTIFKGRIDLIAKFSEKYFVIDYKTGKQENHLQIFWTDKDVLNFKKNKQGTLITDEKLKKDFNYQLPIYYFATQYAKELQKYKNETESFYLQFVRPNNEGSCLKDIVTKSIYDNICEKIIENIKETIVVPIRNKEKFETMPNYSNCENCSYKFLCDTNEEEIFE